MNYLLQIVAFEKWCETNSLPPAAQLLWYKLMHVANGTGWREWFGVDNQRAMWLIRTRDEKTLIRNREKLIQSGLIRYKRGSKGKPSQYKIVTLTGDMPAYVPVEQPAQVAVKKPIQSEPMYPDIDKPQTKYKKNNMNNKVRDHESFDAFWQVYPKKVGKKDAYKAFTKLQPTAAQLAQIVKSVQQHAASDQWQQHGGRFIPNPATFLNGERWLDEVSSSAATNKKTKPSAKAYDQRSLSETQKMDELFNAF